MEKGLEILLLALYGGCLIFLFLYSLAQLHLTLLYRLKAKKPTSLAHLSPLPAVTIQLPIYNEKYVVERLLQSVAALDYPPDKLQILVLDDSTDETVGIVAYHVDRFQRSGINIQHVHRQNRIGYKAGALEEALPISTGEFICIFDADFVPSAEFLKNALPYFIHAKIGVVQTRWGHLNRRYSWLTRLQAFGLDAHFTVEQGGRNSGSHFINFNGTAGIWRKDTIIAAGGWHHDTLTEDLDLSYRAQLQGWQFVYVEDLAVPAELPVTMPALKSQQYRWTKGAAETARKHLAQVLRSQKSWTTKWLAVFHLLNSSVFVAVFLAAMLSVPVMLIRSDYHALDKWFAASSVFKVSFLILGFFYLTAERKLYPKDSSILMFPFRLFLFLTMSLGLSLHNSLAVIEGYAGRKTPFIRTPKFNLETNALSWHQRQYQLSRLSLVTWLEGGLCLYFAAAVALAFVRNDFGFLPYHVMLCLGFGLVFGYSLLHRR